MDINSFRKIIKQREKTDDEWDYGVEQCWEKEIELLTEDVTSTVEFLETECTAEEYSWISEVLESVIDIIPCKELLDCYKSLASKYPDEYEKYNISSVVEACDNILNWEEENGKK